jgi:hypothetical protein
VKPAALAIGIILACVAGLRATSMPTIEASSQSPSEAVAGEVWEGPALILAYEDTVTRDSLEISAVESVEVDPMVFCAAVKDRAPIGVADTFPSDIYAVYCFTRIMGAHETPTVVHSWLRKGRKISNVELSVGSPIWRTWSRKKMRPDLKGEWEVKVIAPDGKVIASKKFFLE